MSSFSVSHIPEPLLEFAGNGRHVDVRFGLTDYGPVDFSTERTKEVRLGVVGSSQTIGKLGDWLRRCEGGVPAKNSRQPNLFPAFPGSTILGPFRCSFEVGNRHVQMLFPSTISRIVSEKDDDTAVALAVEAFANEVKDLARARPTTAGSDLCAAGGDHRARQQHEGSPLPTTKRGAMPARTPNRRTSPSSTRRARTSEER